MSRRRGRLAMVALGLVGLGLACRTPWAPRFAELYLGDVLWGALFYFLFALCRPSASSRALALTAAAVTELIELSQLYRAPWAESLRGTSLGGLLLGHGFSWSDVLCVAVGAALAAALDRRLPLRSARAWSILPAWAGCLRSGWCASRRAAETKVSGARS